MKWRRGQQSQYVEDRRGTRVGRGALAGGGGLAAIIITLLITFLGGGGGGGGFDLDDITGQLGAAPESGGEDVEGGTGGEADDEVEDFMRAVMNDLVAFWSAQGVPEYRPATLVLFAGAVDTACGQATSAVGPFYCPLDEMAYLDVEFFQELHDRFGAPGDFAQAYVIAHEYGHHIQNVLGTMDQVNEAPRSQQQGADGLAVRLELQADCYAGLWANSIFGAGSGEDVSITREDVREALDAAAAIGDDRIQEQAGVGVNPDTWTHGSSEQRVEWFNRGFDGGEVGLCDTFNTEI
jgi:predicted metalloprotease